MIYFIQDQESLSIKIGYTGGSSEGRLKALQTGNGSRLVLLGEVPGDEAAERQLHERFRQSRMVGEWFRPTPDVLAYILRHAKPPGPPAGVCVPRDPCSVWPHRIYLAGKMAGGCGGANWRSAVVDADDALNFDVTELVPDAFPVREGAIFGDHAFTGPFYMEWGRGGDYPPGNAFEDDHGLNVEHGVCNHGHGCDCEDDRLTVSGKTRADIIRLCCDAIDRSDVVFAWLEHLDCYGTVAELGYAHAKGKRVWVAMAREMRDMWFVQKLVEFLITPGMCGGEPRRALEIALRLAEDRRVLGAVKGEPVTAERG